MFKLSPYALVATTVLGMRRFGDGTVTIRGDLKKTLRAMNIKPGTGKRKVTCTRSATEYDLHKYPWMETDIDGDVIFDYDKYQKYDLLGVWQAGDTTCPKYKEALRVFERYFRVEYNESRRREKARQIQLESQRIFRQNFRLLPDDGKKLIACISWDMKFTRKSLNVNRKWNPWDGIIKIIRKTIRRYRQLPLNGDNLRTPDDVLEQISTEFSKRYKERRINPDIDGILGGYARHEELALNFLHYITKLVFVHRECAQPAQAGLKILYNEIIDDKKLLQCARNKSFSEFNAQECQKWIAKRLH